MNESSDVSTASVLGSPTLDMDSFVYRIPYSPTGNPDYIPLSEQTVADDVQIDVDNPVDHIVLEKESPKRSPEDIIQKDRAKVLKDTEELMLFGDFQSRHQDGTRFELVRLLEDEKAILAHMMERSNKFTEMKKDNKFKMEEWEKEHTKRMPSYYQYLDQLAEIPETEGLTQEGMPGEIQQRILYKIVKNTIGITQTSVQQLSLQGTLINDVDLSLNKLRQFCAEMTRHINTCLSSLNSQEAHQSQVIKQWDSIKERIKKMKECKTMVPEGAASTELQNLMNSVDARLARLESTVQEIQSQTGLLGTPTGLSSNANVPSPQQGQIFTHTSPPNRPTQYMPQEAIRRRLFTPSPGQPQTSPQAFPVGEEYFGIPYSPPSPTFTSPRTPAVVPNLTYVDGHLQRSRATPGQFPVDILDVPGMGFPIPRSALERGGRQRGEPTPLTPPAPAPPRFGQFCPIAGSSPKWEIRSPIPPTEVRHPQIGEPLDPNFVPQIQEDLQRLSRKNRNLQDLVTNFRKTRQLLTEEMDKAVRLNQKLQRDLYYAAQEAVKQAQPQQ